MELKVGPELAEHALLIAGYSSNSTLSHIGWDGKTVQRKFFLIIYYIKLFNFDII